MAAEEIWHDETLPLSVATIGEGGEKQYLLRWPDALAKVDFGSLAIHLFAKQGQSDRGALERFVHAQILPRVLAHQGNLVLHAGSIAIDGSLSAFLGPSGSGKSTLMASLFASGVTAIGDDSIMVAGTGAGFGGTPVFKDIWLLPDSLARLFPGRRHKSRGHATKTGVAVAKGVAMGPIPVRAVYVLATADEIAIRRMPPSKACMAIIANSFALDPTDFGRSRAKLSAATRLVENIAVYELSYPRRYDRLNEVREQILRHRDENFVHIHKSSS